MLAGSSRVRITAPTRSPFIALVGIDQKLINSDRLGIDALGGAVEDRSAASGLVLMRWIVFGVIGQALADDRGGSRITGEERELDPIGLFVLNDLPGLRLTYRCDAILVAHHRPYQS